MNQEETARALAGKAARMMDALAAGQDAYARWLDTTPEDEQSQILWWVVHFVKVTLDYQPQAAQEAARKAQVT